MATIPQQTTIKQFIGDGFSTNFSVANLYIPVSDIDGSPALAIYVTPAGQQATPSVDIKIWNTDYTYEPNGDPYTGGILIFNDSNIPDDGSIVTVSRNVPAELSVEFADAQTFSGANLDSALEQVVLVEQQNKTYALDRNLSYIVNTYLPDATISANTQIPVLGENQIWQGTGDSVVAVTLEQNPDVSTLRSELAQNSNVFSGASLVGYYDATDSSETTVDSFLANIDSYIRTQLTITGNLVPVGTMIDFCGATVPAGYLLCDGSAVSRTTYSALFTAISVTWGAGNGTTTFNLPNAARRVTIGSGGSGTATIGNALGDVGGEETHTQTIAEMPAHDHTGSTVSLVYNIPNPVGDDGYNGKSGPQSHNEALQIASQGGGTAFNIMQPSMVVKKCIKY